MSNGKMSECKDVLGYDYQTPVVCDGCGTPKGVEFYCIKCDANLCDPCKTQLIHRKHTVLPLTHPTVVANRMSMKLPCKQHPGDSYGTFCNTCQKLCCPKCIAESHDKHSFSQLEQAAENIRKKLSKYKTRLDEDILGNSKELIDTMVNMLTETQKNADRQRKAVKQKCQTVRKRIDDLETSLLTKIDEMLNEDIKVLEIQLSNIKTNEERTRRQLVYVNDVMMNPSDVQLLISYQSCRDVTAFDIPVVVLPGEIEFIESTKVLSMADEIIGTVIRKSDVTPTDESIKGGFDDDVNQNARVLLPKRNLSGPEIAKLMKTGTRVKRGCDWVFGNEVGLMLLCLVIFCTCLPYIALLI